MIRFEDPIYLWLLILIPILAFIRLIGWRLRRKKLRRFGDIELLKGLMPDVSKYRPTIKFWLLCGALSLMILILARPQMGTKISHEKRNGIETMICLDISNSMLAEDVVPSRLDKSKMLVENLVDHFTNDKIGLIVFAGDAFVQLPITSDYVSAKMFLQNIDPNLIQSQGTHIEQALNLAMKSFTQQDKVGKAIIVITDGEDHEGGAVEMAKNARKKGINVYILGVGDPKGAPIPTGDGGYMKDRSGNTVMTSLNEGMCNEIARAGSGKYIHVDNTSVAQEKLNDELTKLQKGESDSVIYSEYDEQFQAFGIIVILLLLIEICLLESKNPLLKKIKLFNRGENTAQLKKLGIFFILGIMMPLCSIAQNDRTDIRLGNRAYHSQQWTAAEVQYRKALADNPQNTQAMYNLGCALMMQQKDSAAIVMFENAGKAESSKVRKSKSYHNIGVICQNRQMYKEAIEAYKQSLRNNPHDNETRYNLALCKRLLKNQPQNNSKQKQNQDKDQKKDKDEKEQNKNKNEKKEDKQQSEKMSKENAEQLLNAAMQEEKATQQRMKKAMQQPRRNQYEKNW